MYVFCFLFLSAVVAITGSKEGREHCVFGGQSECSLQVEELPESPKAWCFHSQGRDAEGCTVSSDLTLILSAAAISFSFPLISICQCLNAATRL